MAYSLFSITSTATLLFWILFAWNIFFHPFIFILYISIDTKWISYTCYIVESFLIICSANLWDFFGKFNPYTFRVNSNREIYTLTFSCFLYRLKHFYIPFLPFLHLFMFFPHFCFFVLFLFIVAYVFCWVLLEIFQLLYFSALAFLLKFIFCYIFLEILILYMYCFQEFL